MNIVDRFISYTNKQNQIIQENKSEVDRWNTQIAAIIIIAALLLLGTFSTLSLFIETYQPMFYVYLIQFIVVLTVVLFFKRITKKIPPVCFLYILYGFLVAYVTYSSAFVTPKFASVLILLHLIQMPIITIDKSWRVNLIAVLYALFYMIFAVPLKEPRLITDEFFNCLIFLTAGIVLGESLRFAKLENLDLKRQSLIREMIDDLTGLQNRKSLFKYLAELEDTLSVVGIIMIDIDHFKMYNDTYGHQAGDGCLRKIGDCFRSFGEEFRIRFFRYGGEEFLAVSEEYAEEELLSLCIKLNQAVADMKIPHIGGEDSIVTISAGVSGSSQGGNTQNPNSLISQADIAMYTAKMQGKNRVAVYTPEMKI